MLDYSQQDLEALGADITTREIYQQPQVWQQAFANYQKKKEQIEQFLVAISSQARPVRVIFTGAGTSAYVGDTLLPHLREVSQDQPWDFYSVATTDILARPLTYLKREITTILVSFARSGNSPESVACVDLAKQLVDNLYQITITCAEQGQLALQARGDERNLLLLQPAASNDAGFAMTSSFSSMLLTALLVFDPADLSVKTDKFTGLLKLTTAVFDGLDQLASLLQKDFKRVIYLGAGPFFGLAHEAQLKVLELTAGQIATMYESPLGFRHGPKSLVDSDSLVIVFGSSNPYTKLYDLDLVRELAGDGIARGLVLATQTKEDLEQVDQLVLGGQPTDDIYLAFPYLVYAQLLALLTAIKLGNRPDTPSPTGTVNRVVQGVLVHPFEP
ncbi:SIS domain-containing protein [Streptococcus oricebi]|uniref:Tagatose-6-phosphate ketose isomerase n=1 Tax=Streptococcus oricebi TaxID=1547447 RepID=A0ABS5B6D7_9STRE|nr:SIS domain-containing protein [Streptococcus oricebi]MBP2624306.1 tagatose-6-phosphate ketose isomerase [Streptococcus oricebi]